MQNVKPGVVCDAPTLVLWISIHLRQGGVKPVIERENEAVEKIKINPKAGG
jgi:hypothetical protein